jgi:hypothetical protein
MPIAYAAHTETCTFLLDDEGICRQIIRRAAKLPRRDDSVSRCIGAQYVASLDGLTDGGLLAMPKVGAPMLFAYVGPEGRIALVRTGRLLRFDTKVRAGAPDERAPSDESIEVQVDVEVDLDDLGDPTHLFRRAPAAAWNFDTSPPPPRPGDSTPPASRRTVRPPAPLYDPPTPLPVHRVHVVAPGDSAPTLDRERLDTPRKRGVLPSRRRA